LIPEIKFNKSGADTLYTYTYIESLAPTMSEVFYDWSSNTNYCDINGFCTAEQIYYTLNNVDVNQAFKPEQQVIKFPPGTKIIRKTYSLTEEHQEFLRSLLMETEWRGGIFDVQPGNVNTNLTNGAKGFFAICMVKSDSLTVQ
jgi:hypothetical protein